MTTDPQSGAQSSDALAQLEALLQKTRANKGQGGDDGPAGPSSEEYAQAEKLAQEQAAKEAELQAQLEAAEQERLRALEEQRHKMAELSQTPQYQARVQQTHEMAEKDAAHKITTEGHEILQVTTKKL